MNAFRFITRNGGDRHRIRTDRASSSLFPMPNHAVVSVEISPDSLGRIYYQSTYWFGCSLNDVYIPEGAVVEVLKRRGNTWLVTPVTDPSYQVVAYGLADLN